jgi:hypothetical protein
MACFVLQIIRAGRLSQKPVSNDAGKWDKRFGEPLMKWKAYPNLRRRPRAPNKGRGRLQVQIRRAFLSADTQTSSAVYDWCFARCRHRITQRHRHSVWRILMTIADPVARVPPYGAWLWRLREPIGSAIGSNESSAADKSLSGKEK